GHFVKVDQHYQTSKKGIYAIGDMIGGFQLAHAASAEGLRVVEAFCGGETYPVDQNMIPRCLYTDPEVASFGLGEDEAKENHDVTIKSFPFSGNGKALASAETEGFVKIISEQKYQQILGAVVVGSHATEMIHTILAVKESEGTVDELADIIFAHPTLSEAIGEEANSIIDQAIHG
ncbi:MAG: FAD-dependent oxidoreductase, partial [Tetragenococcus halophilus]|nr:FAD-dependent oxidoreductase [Tetragenococcus halophilus]